MLALALALAAAFAASPAPVAPAPDSTAFGSPEALVHYTRGRLFEERGQLEDALAEYFRAMASDPRALGPARRASELSARQGDLQRSLEFAERALAIAPDDARSHWLRGMALFNLGRARDALAALDSATRLDPENLEYWRTLARVADHERDLDALARATRASVDLDDSDPETWFQLASVLARRGEFAAADSALAMAREGNPVRPGVDFLGAWIDEGRGRDDRAIDGYGRHLKMHPDDVTTRQRVVALLAARKRFEEAYQESKAVSRSLPRDPEALETEADLAYRTGHAKEGDERLRAIESLDPANAELAGRAVLVLSRNARGTEAVARARAWSEKHPGGWQGPLLEARALALAGSTDAALEKARAAVAQVPDSLWPRLVLGRIAQQAKRWKEAAGTWEEVLKRRPREAPVALDLAYCREQLGDVDGAVSAARDALTAAPTSPTVLNFLGYLLADHERDLAQAERFVAQAVAAEPENGAYIDSMGWVYFRQGRLAEAREQLERAVAITRGDATVLEHLGDVYRALRLTDLAREQYRRSLAGDTSNQRVRNKLEAIR